MRNSDHDPIVAIATASGRGGIGVVRISFGDASADAISAWMTELLARELAPRVAVYTPFLDRGGEPIDRGIALFFASPNSFTGEDVVELQAHGGPVVLQLLLQRCLDAGSVLGMRIAEPGEFTRRAFLNDKLDLAQAEAVADLIDASTEAAARSANRSLDGVFSQAVTEIADQLVTLRMLVEATLDFPEEEIDFLEAADARGKLAAIREALTRLSGTAKHGALLREGMSVVLAGQPNVGKSSLLNALAGAELAIVTAIAGTTRDKIRQTIQIEGIPLHIVDTAGLRESGDEVERIGIERSWDEIGRADVVLHLLDARQGLTADDEAIAARLPAGVPVVRVFNKIDLVTPPDAAAVGRPGAALSADRAAEGSASSAKEVRLSAKSGEGIDTLRTTLLDVAGAHPGDQSVFIARERHLLALRATAEHLDVAGEHAAHGSQMLDLFAEELRLAHDSLTSITGVFTSDDLLGVIFSRFCIGK
ncbi:MAG: tRNA uridine-5-carboxymethylaminomethyl(34) synthesis GTPase MnmE [Janthinobacterium lividum]